MKPIRLISLPTAFYFLSLAVTIVTTSTTSTATATGLTSTSSIFTFFSSFGGYSRYAYHSQCAITGESTCSVSLMMSSLTRRMHSKSRLAKPSASFGTTTNIHHSHTFRSRCKVCIGCYIPSRPSSSEAAAAAAAEYPASASLSGLQTFTLTGNHCKTRAARSYSHMVVNSKSRGDENYEYVNNPFETIPGGLNSKFSTGEITDPHDFLGVQIPLLEKDSNIDSKYLNNNNANDNNNNDNYNNDEITPKLRKSELKEELKNYRKLQAGGKPVYTVFTNKALEGIYSSLPTSAEELLEVNGIGPKKLQDFGHDILTIVSKYTGKDMSFDLSSSANQLNNNRTTKSHKDNTSPSTSTPSLLQRQTKIDPKTLTQEQLKAANMILNTNQSIIQDCDIETEQKQEGDEKIMTKKNVFITGSAGTGKSYILKYIKESLMDQQVNVGVCAPTGVAAINVNGSTLHSFFGIGLGKGSLPSLLRKVRRSNAAMKRIKDTDVLIIDECSMLSSDLLETLDIVAKTIRENDEQSFGGMQVIAFGDFFQLPPIYIPDELAQSHNHMDSSFDQTHDPNWRPYCFNSPIWSSLGLSKNIVELEEVQRQDEQEFITLLNKVRIGNIQKKDLNDLNHRCLVSPTNPLPTDGIIPTRLYVLNKDVDSENINRLADLQGDEVICRAYDVWKERMPTGTPTALKKKIVESLTMEAPDEVRLKVGAQVMLTRNKDLNRNLVNGSRGVVERIVKNLDAQGLHTPIVRFDNGITMKVEAVESIRYHPEGKEGCLVRMQIPLKLAWAMTIHKSQGTTLTRASLDITKSFEYGQCYVALSRVKNLKGLWLERPATLNNIKVSPQVVDFFGKRILNSKITN